MRHRVPDFPPRALAGLLVIFLTLLFCMSALAEETQDLIIVVDVSTSMSDIFDRVKAEAKQFVSSAQLGDRVTIVTFGASSRLLERARILSSYDIARLLSVLEGMAPTEYATSLSSGMDRGLQEIKQLYASSPDRRRALIWLSDDKDNPPKDITNLITFTSLKQREAQGLPDDNWFAFKAPIEPEAKSDVRWFVDWASRAGMRLEPKLHLDDLGTVLAPNLTREIPVEFQPSTTAIRGTTFSVVAEVTEEDGGRYSAALAVAPQEILCRGDTWQENIKVTFPERLGNYTCRLSFVLPSDKHLAISPPQVSLKARVQPQIRVLEEQDAVVDAIITAAYQEFLQKKPASETVLAPRMRAMLGEEARQSVKRPSLGFGPISPGTRYQANMALFPTKNIPIESLTMKSNFTLPPGLEFRPQFKIAQGTLTAELSLFAGADFILSKGWELQGMISFVTNEPGVGVYPTDIPVKIYTEKGLSRWGKRELPVAATYEQFAKIARIAKSFAAKTAVALLAIVTLCLVYYAVRRYGFPSTDLAGTLEVIKNPTPRKMRFFNLRRMGKLRATSSLTIGSGSGADIVLPHPSVAEMHARITTARTDVGTIVFAQPLHYNPILVNDVAYTRGKEIGDKDILSIGDFVFLYRCPEVYRETIVRFADGRSIPGVLISWDIDSTNFEFLPKGAPSLDAKMVIEFSELKAVFMIRRASRFTGGLSTGVGSRPAGHPVEVIFKDGELLEGYIVGETAEWSKRFYVIPRETNEVALVLVERSAVQNLFTRGEFEKPPFELRRALRTLASRIGV